MKYALTITDGTHDAAFDSDGAAAGETGYSGDNPSFVLWLSTAFPATSYADADAHVADLEAHGLTVDAE